MLSIDETRFRPTELEMLRLLSDGKPHHRDELHKKCCGPSESRVVAVHVSRIRKQVRRVGQDIVCTLVGGRIHYQHVILLTPE